MWKRLGSHIQDWVSFNFGHLIDLFYAALNLNLVLTRILALRIWLLALLIKSLGNYLRLRVIWESWFDPRNSLSIDFCIIVKVLEVATASSHDGIFAFNWSSFISSISVDNLNLVHLSFFSRVNWVDISNWGHLSELVLSAAHEVVCHALAHPIPSEHLNWPSICSSASSYLMAVGVNWWGFKRCRLLLIWIRYWVKLLRWSDQHGIVICIRSTWLMLVMNVEVMAHTDSMIMVSCTFIRISLSWLVCIHINSCVQVWLLRRVLIYAISHLRRRRAAKVI